MTLLELMSCLEDYYATHGNLEVYCTNGIITNAVIAESPDSTTWILLIDNGPRGED